MPIKPKDSLQSNTDLTFPHLVCMFYTSCNFGGNMFIIRIGSDWLRKCKIWQSPVRSVHLALIASCICSMAPVQEFTSTNTSSTQPFFFLEVWQWSNIYHDFLRCQRFWQSITTVQSNHLPCCSNSPIISQLSSHRVQDGHTITKHRSWWRAHNKFEKCHHHKIWQSIWTCHPANILSEILQVLIS